MDGEPTHRYLRNGTKINLAGPGLTAPVRDGRPVPGTWQQIFHLECDVRPRERTVVVTVLGE
jgi:thiamine phosphate synthase YjbQ (UPF0047 family)